MTPIAIRLYSASATHTPAQLDRDEILIVGKDVTRNHVTVRMSALERRVFLILATRQHTITHRDEIVEALYGGRTDGGPEWSSKVVDVAIHTLRDAGAALGFHIRTAHGRGFTLVPSARSADLKEIEHAAA